MRRFFILLGRVGFYFLLFVTILIGGGYAYYQLTLYKPGEAQQGYLSLTRATVLVGGDLEPRSNVTVLIRDGTIVQVAHDDDAVIPAEATRLDLTGYTLAPGLIDLHVHLGGPELEAGQTPGPAHIPGMILEWLRFAPGARRAFLHHGVTTVRDLGNGYEWVTELRRRLRDGELEGPRLYIAGPLFTTPGGHPVVTIFANDPEMIEQGARLPSNPEEARIAVRKLTVGDDPVDVIKVVQERGIPERRTLEPIEPEILRAIVAEAHEHGVPVFAHWGTLKDLEEVLAAGVDGLEHLEPRGALGGWPEEILSSLVEGDLSITPTLTALDAVARRPQSPPPSNVMQEPMRRVVEFHAAGGRIVVGSDAGMPGVRFGAGVHRELELLVESGLTPREALKAATSEAARVLRVERIGAIAIGRAADVLVVDGNPLHDIQAIRNVIMVFRDGRLVVDRRNKKHGS